MRASTSKIGWWFCLLRKALYFIHLWLRDNCQCSKCVHPDTRQRMVDTFSIPKDISVKDIKRAEHVKVEWSDGHIGEYPFRWLAAHNYRKKPYVDRSRALQFRKFKQYTPAVEYPTVSYSDVMAGDEGVMMWLQNIYDWGFCFVKDTPVDPESTEALLKRIAFIRHTHYGGFWDFTADLTYKDTAYTTETLGAHTDNTYFTDPARLQLFHLLSHTGGEGGASLLVDGFKAAQTLLEENQDHARALMSTRHPYHASGNEDVCIQPVEQYPVLKTHSQMRGQLYQIRWNNYDRATKSDWWFDEQERWYEAAGHFNEIIHRSNMEIWTQLEPGTVLIFDNWRMLHGRSEFTGKRRMCGGYINNDDFISRYRLLKFGRENVLQQLGNVKGNPKNPFSFV
ncbi:hypothetical protein BDW59DRAFT_84034 [Aspergillus cavernicola]|uniref:trimethyllysine dioxygenase n=1 Tax=Aspergillus cavernicola TaxID=176166 RepID=A0ABR4IA73_9EURO